MFSEGARQLPLRHISIRVPWNDTGWTGVVCQKPADNIACLILPRIREKREDTKEIQSAGKSWQDLSDDALPPCVSERGQFLAPYELTRQIVHPYSESSKAHQHFAPTPLRFPSYSAACVPFRWMLKESAVQLAQDFELALQDELEDQAHEAMGFKTEFVQVKHNQLAMLDTFFGAVKPRQSLCFFYAKRTPLAEDTRRVIVGVGWVTDVGDAVDYHYSRKGPIESVLWERSIQHSIRPGFSDGFVFPYQAVLEYLNNHPEEDPNQYVAFVPDEQFWSFSYASEHVTNDGAIAALLSCAKTLQAISRTIPGKWDQAIRWVDGRLNELWQMRGPCPGLGAALTAFGIEKGTLVAYELERHQADSANLDPWGLVDKLFADPTSFVAELQSQIGDTLRRKWKSLPAERRALLQLLSRFEITSAQATRYYIHEDKTRSDLRIGIQDKELLANPYLLYELDRVAPDPIILNVIDRGLFPDRTIRDKYPMPKPSQVTDATDARRVRAFVIEQLENWATLGSTLQAKDQVIQAIRSLDVQPACPVDSDLMAVVEDTFQPLIKTAKLKNSAVAYQLARFAQIGELIRTTVKKRMAGKRQIEKINWRKLLDKALEGEAQAEDQVEQDARKEKTAALEELYASRFSVLIGSAGTGKTTLLKVLCSEPQVNASGILLLAPTGKARVRMEKQTGIRGGLTIAQFLLPLDRYEPNTGTYRLSDREKQNAYKTVIIDESSMLTEEQLAAVLDALKGVDRLILVGDPRQLPPIGAGRPFLDIVRSLEPTNVESMFPRIAPGYAELTVRLRQKQNISKNQERNERLDLLFADWFSGRPVDPGADEIWDWISSGKPTEHLRFVRWENSQELQEKLLQAIVEELKLKDAKDVLGFEQSLGGSLYNGVAYFWAGKSGKPGACVKVEDWQVLSPVRALPHGVQSLNRLIQTTFRSQTKKWATQWGRKIPKPMGPEEILYGDKVINIANQRRFDVYPKVGAMQYVANGEIGIAVGQYKGQSAGYSSLPWKLEIEFSSQPDFKYGYWGRDFADEGQPVLELAYALTVHKTQGSEFGITFVILPNPCRLLSRELLYTALTRQKKRIVIFHQGDLHEFKRFSVDDYSDSALRLTNLFQEPRPVIVADRFMEEGLIHRTRRGENVRSKSEVIIANLLYEKKIDYSYEQRLVGTKGGFRYPDFTIEDAESGKVFYWEHLGMLIDPIYRERWERKERWYRDQGILPLETGGGPNGVLITTEDAKNGGIDSSKIEKLVDKVFE